MKAAKGREMCVCYDNVLEIRLLIIGIHKFFTLWSSRRDSFGDAFGFLCCAGYLGNASGFRLFVGLRGGCARLLSSLQLVGGWWFVIVIVVAIFVIFLTLDRETRRTLPLLPLV
jgi:hypothetical protein